MIKKLFFFIPALSVAVGFFGGFSGCDRNPLPWDEWEDTLSTGTCDTCSGETTLRLYAFYPPLPASNQKQGSMVLIPARDSTYTKAGDTNTYHLTTGFEDMDGDPAFISRSFWMDTAEVSRGEWLRVMADPSDTLPLQWPRTGVNWFDAIRYCMKRTALEGLTQVYDTTGWKPDGYPFTPPAVNWSADGYRLPTEDEWEYSAKAGQNLPYPTSDGTWDTAKANVNGAPDTVSPNFNVFLRADSAWIRLAPDSITFDHINRQGDTVSERVPYASVVSEGRVRVYSYSLIKYVDTSISFDTGYLADTMTHDSFKVVYNAVDDVYDTTAYFDTLLMFFSLVGPDTIMDTLFKQIVRTKIFDDALNRERYVYGTLRNQIDSVDEQLNTIDKIWRDTSGSATQLNSIFIVVDTVQAFTRITGHYEWAGLRDVGSYPPNPYGVRDLCGNAFEWCWDASAGNEPDVRGARVDYRGKSSTVRMRRGGDYLSPYLYHRSEFRDEGCAVSPLSVTGFTGFRTVRTAP